MGKKRINKVHLVFDADKRKEFLTGFHKRKLQRQKHAKDEFEKALKEERKRIKAESKESYKKLVASNRDIPELENLMEEQYDEDDTTVKIVTLSTEDIAKQNNWIGENRPKYSNDDEDTDESITEEEDIIPGMELKKKKTVTPTIEREQFDSEKNLKKKLKTLATKRVQKSKVFQMKNKLERQKQRKKSLKQKRQKEKIINKPKKGGKRK